jgi:hypothetical protein
MNRILLFRLKSRLHGNGTPMRFADTILAEPHPKTDEELLSHVEANGGAIIAERGRPLKWISVEEFSEKWKAD